MAESSSSACKSKPQKVITETDMAAAQQLMQLSDEDNSNNNNNNDSKRNKNTDEEVDQSPSKLTSAKIEEIFGKEETNQPKRPRYRSLDSIYMATKPMNARYGKKVRS